MTGSPGFVPPDSGYAARVRQSFERQRIMATLGARLGRVAPGEVAIELAFRDDLTQQHGFLHAGVLTAIADSACGYAAFSLMPAGAAVLSVEYKVNLLAPARGGDVVAVGRVLKRGRTLTVCTGEVRSADERGRLLLTMLATMIEARGRLDLPEGATGEALRAPPP